VSIKGNETDLVNDLVAPTCVYDKAEAIRHLLKKNIQLNQESVVLAAFGGSADLTIIDRPNEEDAALKLFDMAAWETQNFSTGGLRESGDKVKLSNGFLGYNKMTLPSGFNVSYGDILSLCGDYYGNADKPISSADVTSERESRFTKYTWGCLAGDTHDPARLFPIATNEARLKADTLKHSTPEGCSSYVELAENNYDHFAAMVGYSAQENGGGLGAWEAYSAGHSVACQTASNGKADANALEKALMQNACASHFLSDMYAAGQMRNPRRILHGTKLSFFSKLMQHEDNQWGLNVSNKNGNVWRAYGDTCHATARNAKNREIEGSALTASAEGILEAWKSGSPSTCQKDIQVVNLTPDVKLVQNPENAVAQNNSAPLYVPMNDSSVVFGSGNLTRSGIRISTCNMVENHYTWCWSQMSAYHRLMKCPVFFRGNSSFPHLNCHDASAGPCGCHPGSGCGP
jgi:hypothetical protein